MKLRKEIIHFISEAVANQLLNGGVIEVKCTQQELAERIRRVITEDLLVEDRLNDEVREILNRHSQILDKSNVNYSEMFKMLKNRLVKERGLIL